VTTDAVAVPSHSLHRFGCFYPQGRDVCSTRESGPEEQQFSVWRGTITDCYFSLPCCRGLNA